MSIGKKPLSGASGSRLWLCGPAAAGKTTVAKRVARQTGSYWYSTDLYVWRHEERAIDLGLHDGRPGPGTYDRTPFIMDDVSRVGPAQVLIEGAILDPLRIPAKETIIWLRPSRDEQFRRLKARHASGIHSGFLAGWDVIEESFGRAMKSRKIEVICVDNLTVEQVTDLVYGIASSVFDLSPQDGKKCPIPELARESNIDLYRHAMSVYERGFREAAMKPREYICECTRSACFASVVTDLESARVLLGSPIGSFTAHV